MRALAVGIGLLMACTGGDPKTESDEEEVEVGLIDGDGDGFLSDEDCNDNNPLVWDVTNDAEESIS